MSKKDYKHLENVARKFYNSTGFVKQIFADMLEDIFVYQWTGTKDDFNCYIARFR